MTELYCVDELSIILLQGMERMCCYYDIQRGIYN